ncbi:BCCT family transporter [Pleomorphovibrio marinus]|uniref:BCCT family transporter n=1 Tax=Pleomorphovibrio marinus TaxID=2164132 RepID=UPI001E4A6F7E|nr:BCCT family transporter [Pleomorphovibrio marinus]
MISLGCCLLFLIAAFSYTDQVDRAINLSASYTLSYFGGFYLYFGCFLVLGLLGLAISPLGSVKLGKGKPQHGNFSWVAMLFSTGMGAGLLLRAVQEPMHHFQHAPRESPLAADVLALEYTFFHWGFTPWAFYGMFGLIMAFMSYTHNRPMLSSSSIPQILRKRFLIVPVDSLTVLCTVFGVVGAVGLGSKQVLTGIREVGVDLPQSLSSNLLVVWVLGGMATYSAFSGLKKGIRNLSRLNIGLALFLLTFTLVFTLDLENLEVLGLSIGAYLMDFLPMSLNLGNYRVNQLFLTDWTLFYWAFWMAWAPFTGLFIARISSGRSIRSYVLGVLLVPSLGSFIWFAVFGTAAFHFTSTEEFVVGQFDSIYSGIFSFFSHLPFAFITRLIVLLLVATFLITSMDSAIYVLGVFSKAGSLNPGKTSTLVWGILLVGITSSVLLLGKEGLLETITYLMVLVALPFSILYAVMTVYFLTMLNR